MKQAVKCIRTTAPTSNFLEQPVIDALTRWVKEFENGWVPLEFAIGSVDEQGGLPNYWQSLGTGDRTRTEDAACIQDVEASPELEYVVGHARSIDSSVSPVSGIVSGQGWAITRQSDAVDAAVTWVKLHDLTPEQIGARANLGRHDPCRQQIQG